jgi:hypothetical protein
MTLRLPLAFFKALERPEDVAIRDTSKAKWSPTYDCLCDMYIGYPASFNVQTRSFASAHGSLVTCLYPMIYNLHICKYIPHR